jgi:hypothetical protein
MAVSRERFIVAVCDSCGAERLGREGQPPLGFRGSVTETTAVSSRTAEFYACRLDHIGKAARTAISRHDLTPKHAKPELVTQLLVPDPDEEREVADAEVERRTEFHLHEDEQRLREVASGQDQWK